MNNNDLPDTIQFQLKREFIISFIAKSENPWDRRAVNYDDNPISNSLCKEINGYSFAQWEAEGRPPGKKPITLKEKGVIIRSKMPFESSFFYEFSEGGWEDYSRLLFAKGIWEVEDLVGKVITIINKKEYNARKN
jgi:hypothetical protein